MSYAAKQYGIDSDKMADISKDMFEKIGEYSKDGTGTFSDFITVIGVTKSEGKKLAKEFSTLSSEEVMGRVVGMMEDVNATSGEMSWAMEGLGSDLTQLIPLFSENSKILNEMKTRYTDVASKISITAEEGKKLQGTAEVFDLLTKSMGLAGTMVSAQLAPIMDSFFNSFIEVVPIATQAVVNFINSFKTPDEITNLVSVQEQLTDARKDYAEATSELAKTEERLENARGNREKGALKRMFSEQSEEVRILSNTMDALIDKENELTENRLANAEKLSGGSITGSSSGSGYGGGTGNMAEIKAIEDRMKTESQLLREKFEMEVEMIGENNELKLQLEQELMDNMAAIEEGYQLAKEARASKTQKELEKADKQEAKSKANIAKDKAKSEQNYYDAANTIGNALFEDNKLVSSGLAAMNTYVGVTAALSTQNYAGAAAIMIAGMAQVANINSTSKGGSGGGSVPVSSSESSEPESQGQVDATVTDASGLSGSGTFDISQIPDNLAGQLIHKLMALAHQNGDI
jgi:hypothetical protein